MCKGSRGLEIVPTPDVLIDGGVEHVLAKRRLPDTSQDHPGSTSILGVKFEL